jgi:hypothetical protein
MNEKQKAKIIINTLNKIYPKAPVPLKSKNTFYSFNVCTTFCTMYRCKR